MKTGFAFLVLASGITLAACNNNNPDDNTMTEDSTVSTTMAVDNANDSDRYLDLNTGKSVRKDENTGRYVDEQGYPVIFYVDVISKDTFYGANNQKVNNALVHNNGEWKLDDTKIKIDDDEIKIKSGDTKVKMDDDEYKRKTADSKVKAEDGEVKVK